MFHTLMTLADTAAQHARASGHTIADVRTAATHGVPALLPMQRLGAYQDVLTNMGARQFALAKGMATMGAFPAIDMSSFIQLAQLQQAAINRMSDINIKTVKALADIVTSASSVQKANTLAKLMDQEYDLMARCHAVLADQSVAVMGLIENLQIGCGYLFAQRIEATPGA